MYTSDLPTDKDNKVQTLQYADDTVLTSVHVCPRIATRNIQKHLVGLEKYFQDWDIKVNAEKTELITFRPDS